MKLWDSISSVNKKLALVIGMITAAQFAWSYIGPRFHDLPSARLDRYDKAFIVYNRIVEAETEIDKKVLKELGVELYHCNKDQFKTPKFSFVKVEGLFHEAEFSRSKQTYVYKDDYGHWSPIATLK